MRGYRWSSYRAYCGASAAPEWLCAEALLAKMGVGGLGQRRARWREYHEGPLREGPVEGIWERVVAGAVLGSERVVAEIRKSCGRGSKEESRRGELAGGGVGWEAIVEAVERVRGEPWAAFRDRHGDWGRDVALYVGRMRGRMRLGELAVRAGGIGYTAVAQAVSRVRRKAAEDSLWRRRVQSVLQQLSILKM